MSDFTALLDQLKASFDEAVGSNKEGQVPTPLYYSLGQNAFYFQPVTEKAWRLVAKKRIAVGTLSREEMDPDNPDHDKFFCASLAMGMVLQTGVQVSEPVDVADARKIAATIWLLCDLAESGYGDEYLEDNIDAV